MRNTLDRYPSHHPDTAGRVLDGEAVVVTPADSRMHTMNEVGTWLWTHADGSRSVDQLAEALVEDFEVDLETARRDLVAFVEDLEQKGILVLSDAPREGT